MVSAAGDQGSVVVNLAYNSAGKISLFQPGPISEYYSYNGNSFHVRVFLGDSSTSGSLLADLLCNSDQQGNLLNAVSTSYDSLGNPILSDQSVYTFTYDGHGQLIQNTDNETGLGTTQINYIWQNGNITGIIQNGDTATLDYYDKPSAQGDYFWVAGLNPLTYGNIHVRNLLKSITDAGASDYFTYTFDGQGKITGFSVSGVVNSEDTYTWQCP